MPKNERKLTVTEQSQGYSARNTFPRIMLQGKWLQDLGFTVGQKVNIKISENAIVVERGVCGG